jgi:hypothetical protein
MEAVSAVDMVTVVLEGMLKSDMIADVVGW